MDYDHWIAFVLLGYIGINMIREGLSEEDDAIDKNIFSLKSLLFLSIATSIDALAVGVSLTASTDNIYFPAMIIAITTGILAFIGVRF
jgi:putative Mn2+ efflux pump MntP